MHVVSVIGLKIGGSTKSTLTAPPSRRGASCGYFTAIVDTDPQATLRMWSTRRQINGPPVRPETTPEFLNSPPGRRAHSQERCQHHGRLRVTATSDRHRRPTISCSSGSESLSCRRSPVTPLARQR